MMTFVKHETLVQSLRRDDLLVWLKMKKFIKTKFTIQRWESLFIYSKIIVLNIESDINIHIVFMSGCNKNKTDKHLATITNWLWILLNPLPPPGLFSAHSKNLCREKRTTEHINFLVYWEHEENISLSNETFSSTLRYSFTEIRRFRRMVHENAPIFFLVFLYSPTGKCRKIQGRIY